MNKKAIENAVFVIILLFALTAMGLTFWSFQIPLSSPTAYVAAPLQPQAPCQIDCDDDNQSINPGAQEVCDDLIDNNCNGEIDEGCCGNGVQEPSEQCDPPGSRCHQGGNEGICTAADTQQPCSCNTALCKNCGDGICGFDENSQNCQQDCDPECGNFMCEASEGNTCPEDCQADCGNGACETGQHICQDGDCDCPGQQTECNETANSCPEDCGGNNNQCAGNALCQYDRTVFDPGDEGGFINCEEDCCSAPCETDDDCTPNDNFPCIAGTCNSEGFCDFVQVQGCCEEDSECDDQNSCTDDACTNNECVNTNNQDPCTDGNPCTDDVCSGGDCVGTPNTDPCTSDSNPCTDDVCSQGDCTHPNNNANSCTDGDPCTNDVCDDGECAGTPINCDDQDECTIDSCDDGTCIHPNTCECESDSDCDDNNVCTDDDCDDSNECVYTSNTNPCTSDSNPCTDDVCSQGLCSHPNNSEPCDDGDPCTDDVCDDGECAGTPIDCSDDDPCTIDDCEPSELDPESFIPQNGFECTHVFSAQLCPPPRKGGGGGGVTRTQESCCAPCYDDPNEQCEGRVGLSDGDCHQTTSKRCRQPEGEIIPFEFPVQAAEEETEELPDISSLPVPPEQPGQSEMQQSSAIGQSPADELNKRRSRTPIEGAITQDGKASSPAAIAILFLIGIFIGVYAYLNREQIGTFFKKEEKKIEPAVKEIQYEWKQITRPNKKRGKK